MISYKGKNKVLQLIQDAVAKVWRDISRPRMPEGLMD